MLQDELKYAIDSETMNGILAFNTSLVKSVLLFPYSFILKLTLEDFLVPWLTN